MNPDIIQIGPFQLALTLIFVLIAQGGSLLHRLGLGRDITLGALRTFAQLLLMGYVLTAVFAINAWALTLLMFLIMVIAATQIIHGRVAEKKIPFLRPMFVSMLLSYLLVSVTVTGVIIGARPWWKPQYFIPIAGMIIGNSMNALAISLERLFAALRSRRSIVEMKLSLGADFREAAADIVKDAIRAGMISSINAMMGVGIVFLPGMMTGQILAGVDPLIAIRYQIVVMLMLVASTAMASIIVVRLTLKRCFGKAEQLRVDIE